MALRAKGKTVKQIVKKALQATGFSDEALAGTLLQADGRFVAGSKPGRWVPAECADLVAETIIRNEEKERLWLLRKAGRTHQDPAELAPVEHSHEFDHSVEGEFCRRFKISLSGGASTEEVVHLLSSYGAIERLSYRQREGSRLYFCIFQTSTGAQAAYAGIHTGQKINGCRVIVIPPNNNARGKAFVKPKDTAVDLSALSATALRGPTPPRKITVTKPPHPSEKPTDRRVVVFGLPLEFAPEDLLRQLSAFGPLDALAVEPRGSRPTRRAYATFVTASPAVAASASGGVTVGDSVCRVQLVTAAAWGKFSWPPGGAVPVNVAASSAIAILRAATAPLALGTEPQAVLGTALAPTALLLPASSAPPGEPQQKGDRGVEATVTRDAMGGEAAEGEVKGNPAAALPRVPGHVRWVPSRAAEQQAATAADISDPRHSATHDISDPRHSATGKDTGWGAFEKHSRGFASRYLDRFGFTGQRESIAWRGVCGRDYSEVNRAP